MSRRPLLATLLALSACASPYEPGAVRAGKTAAPLDPPAQSGAAERWTVEPGVELQHLVDGTGAPAIVLGGCPGLPAATPWPGLRPLADRYAFHYYELRGCGRSTHPVDRLQGTFRVRALEARVGLAAQVADVERVRRILGANRVVLVGHDAGALVAALYAAEFPQRVTALVLVSPADLLRVPSPSGGPFEPVRANLPKADRDELARFLASYTSLDGAMAQDDAALAALNRGLFPFVSRALAARGVPAKALPLDPDPAGVGGWAVQAMLRSALLPHDWRAAMKAVDAPVLVVHGERDVAPIDASRLFAAAFRGARLVVLGGSSRYPQVEEPAIFAEQVALFLASPSVRAEDAPAGAVAAR